MPPSCNNKLLSDLNFTSISNSVLSIPVRKIGIANPGVLLNENLRGTIYFVLFLWKNFSFKGSSTFPTKGHCFLLGSVNSFCKSNQRPLWSSTTTPPTLNFTYSIIANPTALVQLAYEAGILEKQSVAGGKVISKYISPTKSPFC